VRVQPRASREAIGPAREGALLVRLTAPPVEGQANDALVRLLGRVFGVAPSRVTVVRGAGGREKRVHVGGLRASDARARLAAATGAR